MTRVVTCGIIVDIDAGDDFRMMTFDTDVDFRQVEVRAVVPPSTRATGTVH